VISPSKLVNKKNNWYQSNLWENKFHNYWKKSDRNKINFTYINSKKKVVFFLGKKKVVISMKIVIW